MKLRFVDAVLRPHVAGQGTRCPPRWCPLRPHAGRMGMKKAPLPGWAKTLAVFGC
nr:MAG TPA: hypothetical protein [Caudoviricetes sp.]